jgi:EmrB/QacA subfamily drug resistance transporter
MAARFMTRKTGTLVAAILGSGIVSLDASVVTVALPRIGQELPTKLFGVLEGQSYIYTGYSLALSALLILAGAMSDFYGRRRVFTLGVAAFGVISVLCGAAPNMELLILFRILQGAAGAFLVPGSLALITTTFSGEAQGRAFGTWSAASAVISTLGPFVGGILVDTISWRAAFLINVPLVAVALWFIRRCVDESRDDEATGRFDTLSAMVTALAIGGLAFGAIYGQQRDWRDPVAFAALALGAAATVVLPIMLARSPHPLVPLQLFGSRVFTVINISTFVVYGALAVTFYYLTLFFQGTLGYTAAAVGLAFIPGVMFLILFSSRIGALAVRYGPRWFLVAGPVIMALGVLWFARTPAFSQPWLFQSRSPGTWLPPSGYVTDFLPGLVIFGIGIMTMVAPLTTALMASVPAQRSGVASAINNAVSEVGPLLAGALIFVAITASFYADLARRVPGLDTSSPTVRLEIAPLNPLPARAPAEQKAAAREASTVAFHRAMFMSAGLLLCGALINAIGLGAQSLPRIRFLSGHPHWRRLCVLCHRTRTQVAPGPEGK